MVKEAYYFGLPLLLVGGAALFLRWNIAAGVLIFLALFVFSFFRNPDRVIPGDPGAIVSPGDGRVVVVQDEEHDGKPGKRVSIFLAVWNVHVNRAPAAGRIVKMEYRPGRFRAAMRASASAENEQNIFTLATDAGELVFKQIAGLIARRVVSWKKAGDIVERGERIGLVRFGSRVDLWVPREAEIVVKVGQNVKGGSSVLANWPARKISGPRCRQCCAGRKSGGGWKTFLMLDEQAQQQQMPFRKRRFTNPRLRRGIFLLPSLFTVANLLCGYYAVVASLIGGADSFDRAAKAIGLAILFDSMDGRVARMTGTNTEFGVQLDSLADVCSFGIAPAVMAYAWGVRSLPDLTGTSIRQLGEFGWVCCLAFLVCCAWRLARFNVQGMAPGSSKYFVGMPTPAAAAVIGVAGARIQKSIARLAMVGGDGFCWRLAWAR